MQRPSGERADLRLKQRRQEERVIRQFNCLDAGVARSRSNHQAVLGEPIGVSRREPVVTPVKTDERRIAAQIVHPSPRDGGNVALLANQAAGKTADDEIVGPGSRFSVLGADDACDIAGKLHDRVLEARAGAQEWLT